MVYKTYFFVAEKDAVQGKPIERNAAHGILTLGERVLYMHMQ
jgi:hypothetical protein